jgi:ribosomal protein S18 acetylase RimI-like enzyme
MTRLQLPRRYESPADLTAMQQVLQAGILAAMPAALPMHYVHPGDLNWWLFYPPFGANLFDSIAVWDDPAQPGRLLGWTLADPTWPSFELFVQPELYATPHMTEMLEYAEAQGLRCRQQDTKPMHKLWAAEGDAFQRTWLESKGYKLDGWDIHFRLELSELKPAPDLPPGYTLRLCRGLAEAESRARAQHGAFGSRRPFESYLERFQRFMRSTAYAQALDVVAAAPDGTIAAFAIAWLDSATGQGHLEPVGVHPDHQRLGLGKAVVGEALRRMQAAGMRQATVLTGEKLAPALALYRSAGFQDEQRLGIYSQAC